MSTPTPDRSREALIAWVQERAVNLRSHARTEGGVWAGYLEDAARFDVIAALLQSEGETTTPAIRDGSEDPPMPGFVHVPLNPCERLPDPDYGFDSPALSSPDPLRAAALALVEKMDTPEHYCDCCRSYVQHKLGVGHKPTCELAALKALLEAK